MREVSTTSMLGIFAVLIYKYVTKLICKNIFTQIIFPKSRWLSETIV